MNKVNSLSYRMYRKDPNVVSLEAILLDVSVLFDNLNYFPDLGTQSRHATLYRICVAAVAYERGYSLAEISKALLRSTGAISAMLDKVEESLKHDKELHNLMTICSKRFRCK